MTERKSDPQAEELAALLRLPRLNTSGGNSLAAYYVSKGGHETVTDVSPSQVIGQLIEKANTEPETNG